MLLPGRILNLYTMPSQPRLAIANRWYLQSFRPFAAVAGSTFLYITQNKA